MQQTVKQATTIKGFRRPRPGWLRIVREPSQYPTDLVEIHSPCDVAKALARRFEIRRTDNPDPNALTPIEIAVRLADGRRFEHHLDVVYGNPANAMTRAAHLEKFRCNARAGRQPLGEPAIERLIATVDKLEEVADVGALVDDLSGRQAPA